jgi:hypothetical protein
MRYSLPSNSLPPSRCQTPPQLNYDSASHRSSHSS